MPQPPVHVPLPFALATLLLAPAPGGAESLLDLPIGDPGRRDRMAPVVLDGVTDSARGEVVTPAELAARLDGVRLLLVGESHTEMEFHRVQLRVLEELVRRGRKVRIGLEMYPVAGQDWLDRWIGDEGVDEQAFLAGSRWYHHWGYHWDYYRAIFLFARRQGVPIHGLNVPRALVQTMRREGRSGLAPEQRALLPERIDTDSDEHRRLFRAFFSGEGMHGALSDEQFEGMFRAQCTWDAAMAHNALQVLAGAGGDGSILVVLVGSGHVAYGLGVQRQAALSFAGRIASVLPIPVEDADSGEPVREARASYADFFWGVPLEREPLHPVLGVSTAEQQGDEPLRVLFVSKGSPGEAAGFAPGDEILSMDGAPVPDKETLARRISELRWGDAPRFRVRRGEEERELVAYLRRSVREAEPCPEAPRPPVASEPPAAPEAPQSMPPHGGRP